MIWTVSDASAMLTNIVIMDFKCFISCAKLILIDALILHLMLFLICVYFVILYYFVGGRMLGFWRDVVRRRRERSRCYYVMFISLLLL